MLTQANAEHFAPELPCLEGGSGRLLYPASCKASSELQEGLTARGFVVRTLLAWQVNGVLRLQSLAETGLPASVCCARRQVVRLNTYDTRAVETLPAELLEQAKQAAVVTVASPSAVKCVERARKREAMCTRARCFISLPTHPPCVPGRGCSSVAEGLEPQ